MYLSSGFRLLILFGVVCTPLAWAQLEEGSRADRVILHPGGRTSTRITLTGHIEEYNGEILRIRLKAGETAKEYPTSDVVEVLTDYSPPHERGLKKWASRDYPGAASEFEEAFNDENRRWVRRELLMQLIRCAYATGDTTQATRRFAALIRSDPQTRAFPLIPLSWTRQVPADDLRDLAQSWLLDSKAEVPLRLMAASHLLEEPSLGATAESLLKELSGNGDRRVGWLALTQLWRVRLRSQTPVNDTELKIWQSRLRLIPEELQGGPRYLLGRAYAGRQEYELAAAESLWLPLVHDHDPYLSAKAQYEAAQDLLTIGQLDPAHRLLQEITEKYPQTPSTPLARQALKSLLER